MSQPLRVYLAACAGEEKESPVIHAWREAAARDRRGVHKLTDDPAAADLILFVDLHLCADWRLGPLLNHEFVRSFGDKVLVYDERDQPWCALAGIYCSMPKAHFDSARQRACAYYGAVSFAGDDRAREDPDLLFSFLGSRSHPIRRRILKLSHDRAVIEDTSGFVFYDRSEPAAYDRRKQRFIDTLLRSKFVLCPRGAGTASIRLFETLAAGRVPVIIGDEWVAPTGPAWDAFSLRVRESDISSIPERLEAVEARYPGLSSAAKAVHAEYFDGTIMFHRLVEQCGELLASKAPRTPSSRGVRYVELEFNQIKHDLRASIGKSLRALGLR